MGGAQVALFPGPEVAGRKKVVAPPRHKPVQSTEHEYTLDCGPGSFMVGIYGLLIDASTAQFGSIGIKAMGLKCSDSSFQQKVDIDSTGSDYFHSVCPCGSGVQRIEAGEVGIKMEKKKDVRITGLRVHCSQLAKDRLSVSFSEHGGRTPSWQVKSCGPGLGRARFISKLRVSEISQLYETVGASKIQRVSQVHAISVDMPKCSKPSWPAQIGFDLSRCQQTRRTFSLHRQSQQLAPILMQHRRHMAELDKAQNRERGKSLQMIEDNPPAQQSVQQPVREVRADDLHLPPELEPAVRQQPKHEPARRSKHQLQGSWSDGWVEWWSWMVPTGGQQTFEDLTAAGTKAATLLLIFAMGIAQVGGQALQNDFSEAWRQLRNACSTNN